MQAHLHALAKRYPNVPAALAELANLQAILTLPTPTVHVVSDVHGEYVKLRQVVNNASGWLRPLFERVFGRSLAPAEPGSGLTQPEIDQLLSLVYYPRETWLALTYGKDLAARRALLLELVPRAIEVMRELARN